MTELPEDEHIPFNRPPVVGTEQGYIAEAIARGQLSAGGAFTDRCCSELRLMTGCRNLVLVHSATAALEIAALLLDIGPGDEVVMPSFTFVSAANAVVLRGGVPVFVDVRPETLNIDPGLVADAITPRTKAILPVHYAGVPCDIDAIRHLALDAGVAIVEDAAQALGSTYKGRPAGTFGDVAAVSFHETKNVICGEGGALLVNDDRFVARAEILRDKGTDRGRFFRGEVDKYTWVDIGSSYGLSELGAAFLWAQLEAADELARDRLGTWAYYHDALEPLEREGLLRRPVIPHDVRHNGHIYYVLLESPEERTRVLRELNQARINAVFHYVPLHSAAGGRRFGRAHGSLRITNDVSERLVRLPLWAGMGEHRAGRVVAALERSLRRRRAGLTAASAAEATG